MLRKKDRDKLFDEKPKKPRKYKPSPPEWEIGGWQRLGHGCYRKKIKPAD